MLRFLFLFAFYFLSVLKVLGIYDVFFCPSL